MQALDRLEQLSIYKRRLFQIQRPSLKWNFIIYFVDVDISDCAISPYCISAKLKGGTVTIEYQDMKLPGFYWESKRVFKCCIKTCEKAVTWKKFKNPILYPNLFELL